MYADRNTHSNRFAALSQATVEPLSRRVNEISSNFVVGRQEDPSELFQYLLGHMTNCLSPVDWIWNINSSSTIIQDIFGVQLQSVIVCNKCGNKTLNETWESMWTVSITSQTNLLQALNEFCKEEILSDDNAFHCLTCNQFVPATRSYQLIKTLPVIPVHLKRFVYDQRTNTVNKIKKFIGYPELLDMTPYFDKNIQESLTANKENNVLLYQLHAVVVHLGERAQSGHVYAYIQSPDGLWYKANDSSVTHVDINEVVTNKDAYMLFYSKVSKDKIIFNTSTIEINTTLSSQISLSVPTSTTFENEHDKEINNHQNLVSL
jgi:ubiquitin carboxyl-terminal hydrolase 36/42